MKDQGKPAGEKNHFLTHTVSAKEIQYVFELCSSTYLPVSPSVGIPSPPWHYCQFHSTIVLPDFSGDLKRKCHWILACIQFSVLLIAASLTKLGRLGPLQKSGWGTGSGSNGNVAVQEEHNAGKGRGSWTHCHGEVRERLNCTVQHSAHRWPESSMRG